MSKPTKDELVAALKYAKIKQKRNYKSERYSGGICLCLPNNRAGVYICKVIKKSLGRYNFVRSWLYGCADIPIELLSDWNMYQYRLRWIDQMIGLAHEGKL